MSALLPEMGSPTPYADKLIAFQTARAELVATSKTLTLIHGYPEVIREEMREAHRLAELKLLRLYDDLLTKLQEHNILP